MWRRVPCQHQLNMGESGLSPRINFLCPMCSACQVEKRDEASGGALLMNNNNKSDMMKMMPGKGASGGGRADVRVLQSPQLKKRRSGAGDPNQYINGNG